VHEVLFVLLRGSGSASDLRRTTDALRQHTPATIAANGLRVEVIDSSEAGDTAADEALWGRLESEPNADLVLLKVGALVGPGWQESLRAAAYEDAIVATASAVPTGLLADGDAAGRSVAAGAPDGSSHGAALGEPVWACVYVRRDALNVALAARSSTSDAPLLAPTRLEHALLVPGLVHVLAKTVVSFGHTSAESGAEIVTPAVQRALDALEGESQPIRVTIDLRCCSHPLSGTQVHALNLVVALSRTQDMQLSVLLPPQLHQSVRPHVDALPASVRRLSVDQRSVVRPHVFHRPYQLQGETEITDVLGRGDRLVVTHQDMILDRTPAYFSTKTQWRSYTAATAVSFVAADEVAFYSEHAREEAIRDGLIDPAKTCVVPPGTNHLDDAGPQSRPAALHDGSASEALILVLCNSYFHKNRVFALRVGEELRAEHGWTGVLVFAGGSPPEGSSVADERAFLVQHPKLNSRFVDLGRVSDEEQRWLYRHAALVVYPTLYEGFGLIPFEAAAAGTPCVYSSRSSVAEYLPAEGALLDLADVAATANRLAPLLERADAGEPIVGAIRAAAEELTWNRNAAAYADIYRRALDRPVGLALAAAGDVVVGARSQLAVDSAELGLLFAWRRVPPLRMVARGLFMLVSKLRRIASRR
jgi:glycosyltransferase involved in cell wall biosynthesis